MDRSFETTMDTYTDMDRPFEITMDTYTDMDRPFEITMDTYTDSPAGKGDENNTDRVTSKDPLTSLAGSNHSLSRQSNPSSSQTFRDESCQSNASKISIQSIKINARITTGKKSDRSSSLSSTPQLSYRSLLSDKDQRELSHRSLLSAKDSRESKQRHRKSTRNSAIISTTSDRQSRCTLRNVQHSDNDEHKQPSKQRKTDTPNRESPRTPFASHKVEKKMKANEGLLREKSKVVENGKLEKREQDIVPRKQLNVKIPSRLPVLRQNNNRKVGIPAKATEIDNRLEKRKQDIVPRKQLNVKIPSRLPVLRQNNNRKVGIPAAEIDNRLEKRKQDIVQKKQLNGKLPSRLPVPIHNNRKAEMSAEPAVKMTTKSTTTVRTKSTVNKVNRNDTAKKIQPFNIREKSSGVPKSLPVNDNGKTTKVQKRSSVMNANQEKSKLKDRTKSTINNIHRNDIPKKISTSGSREKASAVPKTRPVKDANGKTTKVQKKISNARDNTSAILKPHPVKNKDGKISKFQGKISDSREKTLAVHKSHPVKYDNGKTSKCQTQTYNSREKSSIVPKSHPVKKANEKITKSHRHAPVTNASQEISELQDTEAKKSAMTAASAGTSRSSSSPPMKQYSRPIPKTVAEAEQLLRRQRTKEDYKVNITTVEPVAECHLLPKTVAEAERLLRIRRMKEESKAHITTVDPVSDVNTTDGQDFNSEKDKQDSALDDSQIERYFKLLAIFKENEEKIEENQRKIDLQEKEMDESYAKIRNETDSLTECIGEVVQARKVHKNFKDEAARIRVHHKTNIIAADMYEAAYIDLQEQIADIHQEIIEAKAINGLKPEDLQIKIEKLWKLYDNQRHTNASLEEEIETLKNDLNEYRCNADRLAKPPDETVTMIQEGLKDTNPKIEVLRAKDMTPDKNVRAGESKSADVVSVTQPEAELKETKSEHRQESRLQKIIRSARALLPHRKKKQSSPKEVNRTQTPTHGAPKLLQKRQQSDSENKGRCLKHTGYDNEEHTPMKNMTPEERHMSDNQKKSELVPYTKKPVLHKRPQQYNDIPNGSEISPGIHIPHPPVSSCPDDARERILRATTQILKHIYKL